MKVKTAISTTHNLTLDPEEWFTVRLAGDKVMTVDSLTATQHGRQGVWTIVLHGSRVRKDGSFGQRMRSVGTWEHSRAFSDSARRAFWAVLSEPVREEMTWRGVRL